MVPEEWPIAAEAADRPVDDVRPRGPSRLSTVRRDFFLDPTERLSEQERALMTTMLHDLVGGLAAEIAVVAGARGAQDDPGQIATALNKAGLLDRAGLVRLMLRRSDEYRIAAAFDGQGPRRLGLLPRLVSDDDPRVAASAMALVIARGRRKDGFGQPRLELSDLSPADASAVTNAVAAIISPGGQHDPRYADAARTVVDAVNEEESLDRAVANLVDAIVDAGRPRDEFLEQASSEGDVALVAELIAKQAGVGPQAAWDHLVNAGEGGLALLARMAGLGRRSAARLVADIGSINASTSIEDEIARYDSLTQAEVDAEKAHWRLPRDYRFARTALGGADG